MPTAFKASALNGRPPDTVFHACIYVLKYLCIQRAQRITRFLFVRRRAEVAAVDHAGASAHVTSHDILKQGSARRVACQLDLVLLNGKSGRS